MGTVKKTQSSDPSRFHLYRPTMSSMASLFVAYRARLSSLRSLASTVSSLRCFSSDAAAAKPVTIAILRETYDKWERRAPLSPSHVQQLVFGHPNVEPETPVQVIVQPSPRRIFPDKEYLHAGAILQENVESADILLAVKRPKDSQVLHPNKTYLFFSHTVKGQPENMALLKDCLDKRIQLIDYERMLDQSGPKPRRVVAFGRFAGLAGCMDSFHAFGRRLLYSYGASTPFLSCPTSLLNDSLDQAKDRVLRMGELLFYEGIDMEPIVFSVTGKGGCVHEGVMELLQLLPHELVQVDDLPQVASQESGPQNKIYVVPVGMEDVFERRLGKAAFDREDYRHHPADYRSTFGKKVAPYSHVLLNCIYWDARYPRLLTKQQMRRLYENGNERLLLVSDISCDVHGSVEFLERRTTIEKPFFQYDPIVEREVADEIDDRGVTVMGVDILPSEFPRESSEHFGDAVIGVVKELINVKAHQAADVSGVMTSGLSSQLGDACITNVEGSLTPSFRYLNTLIKRAPKIDVAENEIMIVALEGHLFDSGFINQVIDVIEQQECGLSFQECFFPSHAPGERIKSSVILRVTGHDEAVLAKVESKIQALADLIEKAEAKVSRVDRKHGDDTAKKRRVEVEERKQKRVLILGAGRVSKSLVHLLGRHGDREIVVAGEHEQEAREVAAVAKNGRHVALDVTNDIHRLSELIEDSDMVISVLPATMHPPVAAECIAHKADLVTASYESAEMRELNDRAKLAGIVILNEVGLDPGLDHMSAMKIIDYIKSRGGTVTGYSSVCGGLPAPEAADNPLKYKFSWSPIGVIRATQNGARYRWGGRTVEVQGRELLQSAAPFIDAWPDLKLECLPNRDSLHYEDVYDIQGAKTLFRGTLRYRGFSSLFNVFKNVGLFDSIKVKEGNWNDVIARLRMRRGGFENVEDFVLACADENRDEADKALDTLRWLGVLDGSKCSSKSHVIDKFCDLLEEKLCYEENERDMVVMHHTIDAAFDDGSEERHHSNLQVFGDGPTTAMAKTVGFTTAASAELILDGSLSSERGLLLPTNRKVYDPVLETIGREGIVFEESHFVTVDPLHLENEQES